LLEFRADKESRNRQASEGNLAHLRGSFNRLPESGKAFFDAFDRGPHTSGAAFDLFLEAIVSALDFLNRRGPFVVDANL
jgi:hypothetical protein